MADAATRRRWLYEEWLGAAYLPWQLQAFWKLLVFGTVAILGYAMSTTPHLGALGYAVLIPLAVIFFVGGIVGRLGG